MVNSESWLSFVELDAIKEYFRQVYDQEVIDIEMIDDDVLRIEVSRKYKSNSKCQFYFYYSSYGCLDVNLYGGFKLKSSFMGDSDNNLWFELVNDANKGRLINGKTYFEEYFARHESIIEESKAEELNRLAKIFEDKKEVYRTYEGKLEEFGLLYGNKVRKKR